MKRITQHKILYSQARAVFAPTVSHRSTEKAIMYLVLLYLDPL